MEYLSKTEVEALQATELSRETQADKYSAFEPVKGERMRNE